MAQNLLSVRKIEAAQPQPKAYMLRDGASLFLRVQPNGSKLWWFRYRLGGVAQNYSIGIFPKVTLEAARTERDWARGLVKKGLDPILEKKTQIAAQLDSNEQTFEVIARDWMRANSDWSDYYAKQVENYLTKDVFPKIGMLPITSIKASHLRPVIKAVEARGAQSVAILIRQWVGQIFRYAAANGICEYDPTSLLKGLVKRPPVRHNPPLKWAEVPVFLNKLHGWSGFRTTEIALRLVALTFVRTVEIRRATWDQFDLDSAIWEVPAKNMKMRRPHLVFLSKQAVTLLRELETLTGAGQLLFPNNRRPKEPMSATTLNRVLERLGYGGQFSTHGFRSTATTILGLLGYPENRVDLQLAHQKKKDTSRASYDHTKYVSSRRMIMQDWADILDALERGDSVDKITKDFGPMSKRRGALLKIIERE